MAALGVDTRLSGRRLDDSPAGTVARAGVPEAQPQLLLNVVLIAVGAAGLTAQRRIWTGTQPGRLAGNGCRHAARRSGMDLPFRPVYPVRDQGPRTGRR